jgi:hypothetical protein
MGAWPQLHWKLPKESKMSSAQRRSAPGGWLPRFVLPALGGLAYAVVIRPWVSRWGATVEEASTPLPGDDLVPEPAYVTTRAMMVRAPTRGVWPRLVQLGQGRGGFYTYDRLEQMVGAGIRSVDRIVPELQQLAVGDTVPFSPVGGSKVRTP